MLLGRGDGSFGGPTPFAAGPNPEFVVVGDFNADSRPDLAVADGIGVSVLLGRGDGSFGGPHNFGAEQESQSVAVGDFNSDSRPDLAVANEGSNDVSVLLNNTATAGEDLLTGNARNNVICGLAASDGDQGPRGRRHAVRRGREGGPSLRRCGGG